MSRLAGFDAICSLLIVQDDCQEGMVSLGAGNRKRALAELREPVQVDADFFTHADANSRCGTWRSGSATWCARLMWCGGSRKTSLTIVSSPSSSRLAKQVGGNKSVRL
jgi:hypothetical protein